MYIYMYIYIKTETNAIFKCVTSNIWIKKKHNLYIDIYIYIDKSWEVYVGETVIKNSDCVKLQCIKIDSKLHFWWSCLRSM